jgi:hypothetical protein
MQLLPIHGSDRTTFRKETKFNFKDCTSASEFKTIEARIDSNRKFKMSGGNLQVWQDHNPNIESIDVILRPVLVDATDSVQVAKFKKANTFFN